jgi:D-alanyl-D-alanine carboxypeptidase
MSQPAGPDDEVDRGGPPHGDETGGGDPIAARRRRRVLLWSTAVVAVFAIIAVVVGAANLAGSGTSGAGDGEPAASGTATAAPEASGPLDPALVAELEAALDEGFAASGMPGVIVGLWIPGEGEWVSARGVADIDSAAPIERGNQQKIGSITKTIVASVMLQVIGEPDSGVRLDDTLDRWYPDFPEASRITVRMLLNMSSGVGESGQPQVDRICADPYAIPTSDELIAIGAATPRADFAPGEGYEYANTNYFLLGGILEQVTGADLATLIRDRITEPFGMDRSRYALDGQVVAPLTHGYSLFCPARGEPVDTVDWSNGQGGAAGAMVSTLDDIHAWGEALGAGAGVTPALQAARYADVAPNSGTGGNGYGLGIGVQHDPGTGCVLSVSHNGAEPGYGTSVAYFPSTGAVFALLGNGDGGTGVASLEVGAALAPVLLPVVIEAPTGPCTAPWG